MKIERLVIAFNNYDFTHDGVPARSYGAKVDLVGADGRFIVPLRVDTVEALLQKVSPEVRDFIQQQCDEITVNSLIAQGNLLEHEGD